jgi:hypothetical protein
MLRALAVAAVLAAVAAAGEFPHNAHHAAAAQRCRALAAGAAPLVKATLNDTQAKTGWYALRIAKTAATPKAGDANYDAAWYAAGKAEGALLQKQIFQHWTNTVKPTASAALAPGIAAWLKTHIAFIQANVAAKAATDPFWAATGNLMMQLEGIFEGYSAAAPAAEQLSVFDLFVFNFQYELGDVAAYANVSKQAHHSYLYAKGGCTGYIKPTATDLFMTHTTWDGFNAMLRVYKDYDFAATRVAFSSYPGFLASGDDWYLLGSGMTVQETTNIIANTEANRFTIPNSVAEFMRVMVANQLGKDGQDWVETFRRYNSGTYNNQYMVVNMNLYEAGMALNELPDGLLWITEQLPGMAPIRDVTDVVRQKGYWESYNLPYFTETYIASGTQALQEKYGDIASYTKYARPQIIKRQQGNVTDLAGVQKLIRFNEWQTDPLSECPGCTPKSNPMLSIASRGDLIPAGGDWGKWLGAAETGGQLAGPTAFGAIDAKITSYSMFKNHFAGVVQSGPTHETQKAFQWSKSPAGKLGATSSHVGQPDLFDFDWVFTPDFFAGA